MTITVSHEQHTLLLVAGITAVLALATLVGLVLKVTVARRQPHGVIDNLNARIKTWWVISMVIGIALAAGRAGVTLLFALASFAALREFAIPEPGGRSNRPMLLASLFLVLPVQYLLVWFECHTLYGLFIPVYALLALPVLAALSGGCHNLLQRAAPVQWGLILCVYCISYVPALMTLRIPGYDGRNAFLVAFLILIVQASDVLQYIWGKLAGRRRIAPRLSPSKTIEGMVGGVLSATALGAALSWITPFTVVQAALISLAIALLGFLGGLVMSAIKRRRGVKDWGTMIAGHGGMLDRLDSVCFSAPVFFYAVRYWWVP